MACAEEVQGGLGYADVGFDAYDGDLGWVGGGGEGGVGGDGREVHAEAGFVVVCEGGCEEGLEFGDGVAEAGAVLGGHEGGDLEGGGGAEEFLRCEDAAGRAGG